MEEGLTPDEIHLIRNYCLYTINAVSLEYQEGIDALLKLRNRMLVRTFEVGISKALYFNLTDSGMVIYKLLRSNDANLEDFEAKCNVVAGKVVGVTVTNGGSGYVTSPTITFP